MKKSRLANEPVTQATFNRLPLLLRAAEVKWAVGCSDAELRAYVQGGQIGTVTNGGPLGHWQPKDGKRRRKCKRHYKKYTKLSVAKLIGLTV